MDGAQQAAIFDSLQELVACAVELGGAQERHRVAALDEQEIGEDLQRLGAAVSANIMG